MGLAFERLLQDVQLLIQLGQLLALGAILIVVGFWRRTPSFMRHAFAANVLLMTAGDAGISTRDAMIDAWMHDYTGAVPGAYFWTKPQTRSLLPMPGRLTMLSSNPKLILY